MVRNSLKKNYEINTGTLLESFQTIGEWTRGGAAGSISIDTAHFTEGTKSISITFESGTAVFYDKTINQVVQGGVSSMLLKIYIPSLTNLGSVALYFASVSNFSKFFSKTIQATSLHEGYNYISIAPSEWTNSGGESWGNTMVRLRIRVNATTGTPSCSFCSIHTAQYNKAKVLLTFDDSWESQYTKAFSYMQSKGLRGTIYTINTKIGTAGYMTMANLREVYDAGWDLGIHGSTNYSTYGTEDEILADMSSCRTFLASFPRGLGHVAYPNGGYNANVLSAMGKLGMKTGRTIIDRNQGNYLDEKYLLTRQGIYNTTTVAATKALIDSAVAQGTAILLNYHLIVDSTADVSTKVLTADFNEIVDYIKLKQDKNELDVVTISEWYDGLDGRRMSATARTTATNRVSVRDMGTALSFDGVDDNVAASAIAEIKQGNPITISMWFKITDNSDGTLFANRIGTTTQNLHFGYRASAKRIEGAFFTAGAPNLYFGRFTSPRLNFATWYHLVVVYDGTVLNQGTDGTDHYLNGVLKTRASSNFGGAGAIDGLSFGSQTNGLNYFAGTIDEPRIWNRALTPTEIQNLYLNNIVPQDGLVAEYLFDEATGTTAIDTSGNGNNGTITGATYTTDVPLIERVTI